LITRGGDARYEAHDPNNNHKRCEIENLDSIQKMMTRIFHPSVSSKMSLCFSVRQQPSDDAPLRIVYTPNCSATLALPFDVQAIASLEGRL
jgi:hypothetical protein